MGFRGGSGRDGKIGFVNTERVFREAAPPSAPAEAGARVRRAHQELGKMEKQGRDCRPSSSART